MSDKLIRQIHYLVDNEFVVTPLSGKKPLLKEWQTFNLEDSRKAAIDKVKRGSANNIGILTGKKSGIVVIDIDKRENGINNWLNMIKDNKMEETFVVETGSGGYHIYYQYDERLSSCRKLTGIGIDFKSDGGQVVAPGSTHSDTGRLYTISYGYKNDTIILAKFPEFLISTFSIF